MQCLGHARDKRPGDVAALDAVAQLWTHGVEVDDRLIQVLINLISNAVKFTEQGAVTITLNRDEADLIFEVEDTGSGIAPEYQAVIFEKFKQVEDQQAGKPKGTGLGLSICKDIIEYHGGRIWVTSEVGKGSNFGFSLPIKGK